MSGITAENRTKHQQRQVKDLIALTYEYLVDNFHKFSPANKLKVALEIQKRVLGNENQQGNTYHIYNDYRSRLIDLSTEQLDSILDRYKTV